MTACSFRISLKRSLLTFIELGAKGTGGSKHVCKSLKVTNRTNKRIHSFSKRPGFNQTSLTPRSSEPEPEQGFRQRASQALPTLFPWPPPSFLPCEGPCLCVHKLLWAKTCVRTFQPQVQAPNFINAVLWPPPGPKNYKFLRACSTVNSKVTSKGASSGRQCLASW